MPNRSRRVATKRSNIVLAVSLGTIVAIGQLAQPNRALAAEAPLAADAPIKVERCAVLVRSVLQDPFNGLRAEFASGVSVRFFNLRRVPATTIRLSVRYEGSTETIVDRGTFATDVPINRTFANFAGAPSGGEGATCRVTSVTFEDGTQWTDGPAT